MVARIYNGTTKRPKIVTLVNPRNVCVATKALHCTSDPLEFANRLGALARQSQCVNVLLDVRHPHKLTVKRYLTKQGFSVHYLRDAT